MAGHHDEHHSTEKKPVSFTVPFILATVTIIITLLFLSLCDPKPHHGNHEGGHDGVENKAHLKHEENHASATANTESDHAPAAVKDTAHAAGAAPAEGQHH